MVSSVTVEAEAFSGLKNSQFVVEQNGAASGNRLIRLPFGDNGGAHGIEGSVRDSLTEVSPGKYDLKVFYFDENDGRSPVTLKILDSSGKVTYSTDWVMNANTGSNVANSSNLISKTFSGITIPQGATLVIEGEADGNANTGEFLRFDKVVFTDAGTSGQTSGSTSGNTSNSSGTLFDADGSDNFSWAGAWEGSSVGIKIDSNRNDVSQLLISDDRFEFKSDGTVVLSETGALHGVDDVTFDVKAVFSDGSSATETFNFDVIGWRSGNESQVTSFDGSNNYTSAPSVPSSGGTSGGSTGGNNSSSGGGGGDGKFPAAYARLDNGVNLERSRLSDISDADLKYMKSIGVDHIRILPLNLEHTYKAGSNFNLENDGHFKDTMAFAQKIIDAGMAVVIGTSGTGGRTNNVAFLDDPSNTWSMNDFARFYGEYASYVNDHFSPEDFFIESLNEPFMTDNNAWWRAQEKILDAVRENAPDHTFIASSNGRVGEKGWSFINALKQVEPYDDDNVAYNIHYYNPSAFTAQGAAWNDYGVNFSGVSYPGAFNYNLSKMKSEMNSLAEWADKHDVFITVNEIGAINNAPNSDRAAWLSDARTAIEDHGWGWTVWEYLSSFSITKTDSNGRETVLPEFQKALTFGQYQDGDAFKAEFGYTYNDDFWS